MLRMFEQLECSEEDQSKLCRLSSSDKKEENAIFYEAKRYYRPITMNGHNECEDGWVLNDNPIGEESHFGSIFFSTCNTEDDRIKRYIAKVIRQTQETGMISDILKEMEIQQYVYNHCPVITTPVYQVFVEKNDQFVIMITDLIDGQTVRRYMETKLKTFSSENLKNVKKMLIYCKKFLKYLNMRCNVYHGDSHLNNFMITNDEKVLKMIDFGNGEILEGKDKEYKKQKYFHSVSKLNTSFLMIMKDMAVQTGLKQYDVMVLKIIRDTDEIVNQYDGMALPVLNEKEY